MVTETLKLLCRLLFDVNNTWVKFEIDLIFGLIKLVKSSSSSLKQNPSF